MTSGRFIASKLRFKGTLAVCATAVSFLVIIVSLAISSGFRKEIHNSLSEAHGDILLMSRILPGALDSISGIREIRPAVYSAGIVKSGLHVRGVRFRGTERSDSTSLMVDIPLGFASGMNLSPGDRMLAYFVSDKVRARNFTVRNIIDDIPGSDGTVTINANLEDLQRLEGLGKDEFSAVEIVLDGPERDRDRQKAKAAEIAYRCGRQASSLSERYPQLYDWLDLIDVNVTAILILMTIVAGFNMISGLLIYLFRHTSTIGILKSLGMDNRGISRVFLRISSRVVLEGMAAGNALALLFCLVQDKTHILKLDAANYFLSFVPVNLSPLAIIVTDASAYLAIMLMLLLPTLFISKVDPARTIRNL
ncbi:MAG: hypothetical protein MJY50_04175 [Bacteroidales bacterium]|nr:hypothetical protein [Bacteroidales bacterium]